MSNQSNIIGIDNKLLPDRDGLMGFRHNGVGGQHKGFLAFLTLKPLFSIFFAVLDDILLSAIRTARTFLLCGQELEGKLQQQANLFLGQVAYELQQFLHCAHCYFLHNYCCGSIIAKVLSNKPDYEVLSVCKSGL